MQDAAVAPRRDDRPVGRHLRPALAELVIEFGFQAEFMQPGTAGLHGAYVRLSGNPRGFAHHLHFCRRFIQAHVVQQMIQGNEFVRRLGTEVGLGADHVDPLHQVAVEFGVAAHGRIHPVTAFDQARQDVVDIGDGKGVVGAEVANRAFLPGTQAIPQFALGVALAAEQDVFAMHATRHQHQYRLRFREAAEVLEVAVLAVDVLDVAVTNGHRGGGQDGDAVGFHLRHQGLAATAVFRFRDVDHGQMAFPGKRLVQRRFGGGRYVFFGLGEQQQRSDAQVFHDFHVVVFAVVGLFQGILHLGNGRQILQHLGGLGAQGAAVTAVQAETAEETLAPLAQCDSTVGEGGVIGRQKQNDGHVIAR
ncbi:hypothetical protein D3C73_844560 [compost metagenome]